MLPLQRCGTQKSRLHKRQGRDQLLQLQGGRPLGARLSHEGQPLLLLQSRRTYFKWVGNLLCNLAALADIFFIIIFRELSHRSTEEYTPTWIELSNNPATTSNLQQQQSNMKPTSITNESSRFLWWKKRWKSAQMKKTHNKWNDDGKWKKNLTFWKSTRKVFWLTTLFLLN